MASILNLETATTNCSVSIALNGELVALVEHDSASYSHAEKLHVFIREALQKASLSFSGLDAIAVSKGPGSYTGLRIGVAAAKGLCFALDLPLIAVPTLKSMAQQHSLNKNDVAIAVLDARRMEVYSCVFDHLGREIRETKAEIIDNESFKAYTTYDQVVVLGNGAEKCEGVLTHPNFTFEKGIVPSAREMASLSYQSFAKGNFEDVAYFEPYYLKDFMPITNRK